MHGSSRKLLRITLVPCRFFFYRHLYKTLAGRLPRKSDDSDDEVLLLYAVGNKRERKWVQEVHIKRREFGEFHHLMKQLRQDKVNPLNPELNPICYLLALLAHHFLHVSRIMVKSLTLRLLMSYIYIYIYI